jgi:hypothetical protein
MGETILIGQSQQTNRGTEGRKPNRPSPNNYFKHINGHEQVANHRNAKPLFAISSIKQIDNGKLRQSL